MAEKSTIARPYAKALFALWREPRTTALAREHEQLAQWSQLLEAGAAVVADERVARLLHSPHVTVAQLADLVVDIVAAILGGKDVSAEARNLIQALAANRRLGFLPEIADRFARLRAESEHIVDVTVTSAAPLNEAQQRQYSMALKLRLQREVRLHYALDPALIGGAVLRADDLVIDGSLRGRLERLRTQVAG